jgi:pimeloyl-ACP methyl ester carboxylesterase
MMKGILKIGVLAITLVSLLLGGCISEPLLPYSLDTPPLVLSPAELANVEDGRGRFREIYCAVQKDHGAGLPYDRPCEDVILRLGGEPEPTGNPVFFGPPKLKLRVLIVPGIFNDCIKFSSAYTYAAAHLELLGYRAEGIAVSGRSSSTYNALELRNEILGKELSPGERIVLVGYSKGAADILEAVSDYPEIRQKVAAVVSVAGTVNGSPLADQIGKPFQELINKISLLPCPPGVGDPIESLKRSTRLQWLSRNSLPESIKYFSLAAFAGRDDISGILQPFYDQLAMIDPRNDSQVIFYDAIIPGSTLLGFVKADHWAVAMPFSRDAPQLSHAVIDKNEFPREVLLEAIIRFVEEKLLASD